MTTRSIAAHLRHLIRLDAQLDRPGMVLAIRNGIEFHGANVWSLILAILVASIGLNLNSPAVIIGAMLISPLMGPISGAGLALATYDLTLLRKALANLALMTLISIIVSMLYFWVSPLNQKTTEILARTTPTFFDVLIAILGGSALMVGLSQRPTSSNLLAGVAIATALMPPLCTAGFGLATRDWPVFFGAFYLYLINSVFIGLMTFLFSKALRLREQHHEEETENPDPVQDAKVRKRHVILTAVAIAVFVTPSLFIAYNVVVESSWRARLQAFQNNNLSFPATQVVDAKVTTIGGKKYFEVAVVGAALSQDLVDHLNQQMAQYDLGDLTLRVSQQNANSATQQTTTADASSPTTNVTGLVPEVTKELEVLFPAMAQVAWGDLTHQASSDGQKAVVPSAFVRWTVAPSDADKARLAAFLRMRLGQSELDVVNEVLTPADVSKEKP